MEELDEDDEAWGMYDGQCVACDLWGRVNDLGLCEECAGKLERDLIRQRDWDYAAATWALDADAREKLRREVISKYGKTLELIAPPEKAHRTHRPGLRHHQYPKKQIGE